MNFLKKIFGAATSILPGGRIIKSILAPGKTPEEVKAGLSALTPIAQYNKTLARPRIAQSIVYTYLLGVIIQWIQQLFFHVAKENVIAIPDNLIKFSIVVVGAYFGSRGFENIIEKIFKKKEKKS